MAYRPHVKLTVSGIMGTVAAPVEIWSWGLALDFAGDFGDPFIPELLYRGDVEDAITAMHAEAGTAISGGCHLTSIKWSLVDSAGHYTVPPEEAFFDIAGGDASGACHPYQASLCVSLTGPADIRPVRGRYFLPAVCSQVIAATGQISTANRNIILARQVTMLEGINLALNAIPGENKMRVVIASQGRTSPPRDATNATVTSVRLGRVFDTQRRRRNDLQEDYASTTLS